MRLRRRHSMFTAAISMIVGTALLLPGAVVAQDDEAAAEPTPMAQMRFLAGHRFLPTDMLMNGEPVYEGLGYATITDYVDVPAGSQLLQAVGVQSTEETLELKPGRRYTAVLVPGLEGVELRVVVDKAKPKNGQAQARVVSMCSNCGPLSYTASGQKKPLAKGLDYDEGKFAGKYAKVKSGRLDLIPRAAGDPKPVADFDPTTLAPGTSSSLFVIGQDHNSLMLVPALDAAISNVRFLNASREPKVVDVYVDGKQVTKRLFPGAAAEKVVNLVAGDHLVQVTEAGTKPSVAVLNEGMVDFLGGAVAVEAVAGETLEAAPMPTKRGHKPKQTRIRFAHVDPEIPAVDIDLRGMEPVLGLEAGEWTGYLTVPGDSSYAWIRPSDDPASIYHELPLDLGPRVNVTAYLGGSPDIPTVEFVIVTDPFAKAKKKKN